MLKDRAVVTKELQVSSRSSDAVQPRRTKTFYHSVASHNQTALTAEDAKDAEVTKVVLSCGRRILFFE